MDKQEADTEKFGKEENSPAVPPEDQSSGRQEELRLEACYTCIKALGCFYNFKVNDGLAFIYIYLLREHYELEDINAFILKVMDDPYSHFEQFPTIKKIRESMVPDFDAQKTTKEIASNLLDIYSQYGNAAIEPTNWPFYVSFQEFILEDYGSLTLEAVEKFGKWSDVCNEIDSIRKFLGFKPEESRLRRIKSALEVKLSEKITHFLKDPIPVEF